VLFQSGFGLRRETGGKPQQRESERELGREAGVKVEREREREGEREREREREEEEESGNGQQQQQQRQQHGVYTI
jgi:hypothetical protein